jgi:hypothetical protein
MDFIERIFGIAPDAGAGTLEVVIILVPAMLLLAQVMQHRRSR